MDTSNESVQADIAAMGTALEALTGIPTADRRSWALRWLWDRVSGDLARLREAERIEQVAALASAVLGEP